jgi:hypothetical protein
VSEYTKGTLAKHASAETTDDLDGLTLAQYREFVSRVAGAAPGVYDEVVAAVLGGAE